MLKSHLKVLMAIKNVTQKKLYEDTKIRKDKLKQISDNTNNSLTFSELARLCEYFDCEVNDIITYEYDE